MKDDSVKLTREELYKRVWSTPATKLAKEFGISDVALGKICKKLNIPKPYPGYWRRIEVGRKVKPKPLPRAKQGVPTDVVIYPTPSGNTFQPQDPEVLERIKSESQPDNQIRVADTLHNPHPLVRQTRQVLERARSDENGVARRIWNQNCLSLRISKTSLHRALRIMDALIKALERRGYSVEIRKDGSAGTIVHIGEDNLKVRLTEKVSRSERELTAKEKSEPSYSVSDRWVYTPSGKLTFEIDKYSFGYKKRWTDKEQKPLEDQLNDVIAGLIVAAEAERLKRIEREEQRRQWREEEQRHIKTQELVDTLEEHIESWYESQKIREFLQACESSIVQRAGEIAPESTESRWLRWAHNYADWLDPLKNGEFEVSLQQIT